MAPILTIGTNTLVPFIKAYESIKLDFINQPRHGCLLFFDKSKRSSKLSPCFYINISKINRYINRCSRNGKSLDQETRICLLKFLKLENIQCSISLLSHNILLIKTNWIVTIFPRRNNKESANQSPIVSTQGVLGLHLNLHRSTALIVSKYQHFTHQHTQVIISISELQ